MDIEFENSWNAVIKKISEPYGADLDVQAILFLIGVQELGMGYKKFTKDQKLDVIHIAICTLLSQYGYYDYEGVDADGWPHWKATEKLPHLKPLQQSHLMRQAIVEYFNNREED
jgi:hypothetical protein